MITIIFEAHGTTYDNEKGISSGHSDAQLSPLGIKQSKKMGDRYGGVRFDAIFTSDLSRAEDSAIIAFDAKFPVVKDYRLRECDYGDFTQYPSEEVEKQKLMRITEPFPNGESYTQTTARTKSFLDDLKRNYDGKRVMIVGY